MHGPAGRPPHGETAGFLRRRVSKAGRRMNPAKGKVYDKFSLSSLRTKQREMVLNGSPQTNGVAFPHKENCECDETS